MNRLMAVISPRRPHRPLAILLTLLLAISISGCLPFFGSVTNNQNATITALQATIISKPSATNTAPASATPQPTNTKAPTAAPPTVAPATVAPPATTAAVLFSTEPPSTPAGVTNPGGSQDQQILNSQVLLYEDITSNPEVFRYVAAAVQRLGFPPGAVTDVGDAQGNLLKYMQSGAPGGQPWDLIIIANENDESIQGTFFEVLEQILNNGHTRVILESWHLDKISEGTVKPILLRCGVSVYNWEGQSSAELNMIALDPSSPLLNEVIPVKSFDILDYWQQYDDMGDLMVPTGTGDAKIVVGAASAPQGQNGVLTECENSHLILQTFSSHNYQDQTSVSMWMNYIHYMLRLVHGG